MEEAIKLLEERVAYLKDLVTRVPIAKSFTTQSRLVEAEHILALLKAPKK